MAIAIGNSPRGCGTKKDGWYMTGGAMSPNGLLLPLVWSLGDMVLEGNRNLLWHVPPRALHQIDGEYSLDSCTLVEHRVGVLARSLGTYHGSGQIQLQRLHHTNNEPLCLLKHTGGSFYTPATKAIELVQQGPSERMDADTVIAMAKYLRLAPLKLFYASGQVGHFESYEARERFMDYVYLEQPDDEYLKLKVFWNLDYDEGKTFYGPTFARESWRWTMIRHGDERIFPDNGAQHWWVKLLSYQHRHPDIVIEGLQNVEAVFCGTHLTQALRVVTYETAQQMIGRDEVDPAHVDDEALLPTNKRHALNHGVKVAILPPQGQEAWS